MARAPLKFGDEILSVDGVPYSTIAPFRSKMGNTVDVQIRTATARSRKHTKSQLSPPTKALSDVTEASARVIERNGRRIGYLHV
jgi:carboxyl-terminal processing protease